MKELSLNILDIAQNSVTAGATVIRITLTETASELEISVADDGCGMSDEMAASVADPFCTTRKTRKVGLGIPFFKMEAEQTGGSFSIKSRKKELYPEDHGTETKAVFNKDSIDFTPLGDVVSTICTLIHGAGNADIVFTHTSPQGGVSLDTRELREVLGEVPLGTPEVMEWIRAALQEQYENIGYK